MIIPKQNTCFNIISNIKKFDLKGNIHQNQMKKKNKLFIIERQEQFNYLTL